MRAARLLMALWTGASLLVLPAPARAEEAAAQQDEVETFRQAVREGTRSLAAAVDSFFSEREYEEKLNETSLSLKLGGVYMTKDGWDTVSQPRLRLRLPNAERRFLVEIVGERTSGAATQDFFLDEGLDSADADYGSLALRLKLFETIGTVAVTPEVGLRFADFTPQAFAGARVSRDWGLSENWTFYASQRVRAHTDRGLETKSLIRADRRVRVWRNGLFRADFTLDWRADEPGVKYGPGLSLYTPIDDISAVAVETSLGFETDPEHLVEVAAATIRYRRKVFYDWWTAEIAPRIEFAEEHDYDANYGARVQMEFDF